MGFLKRATHIGRRKESMNRLNHAMCAGLVRFPPSLFGLRVRMVGDFIDLVAIEPEAPTT